MMNVYVYTNQGLTRVYKYKDRAFKQLLEDEGFDTLKEYVDYTRDYGVWVDWDDEQFSVDDGGPEIKKVQYFELPPL